MNSCGMRGIIQMKRRASHLDINIASESSKEERNPQLFTIPYYLFTEPTGPQMRYSHAVASCDCGAVRAQSIGALPCGAYRCGGIPRKSGAGTGNAQDTANISRQSSANLHRWRPARRAGPTTRAGMAVGAGRRPYRAGRSAP